MADVIPLEIEIRLSSMEKMLERITKSIESAVDKGVSKGGGKSADSFSARVGASVNRTIGNFKPIKTEGGNGGNVAIGVAAGLAAGGAIGLLKIIADSLMDIPVIAGIMKLFKIIIMLLLMPLIPILKPVMQLLGGIIKAWAPHAREDVNKPLFEAVLPLIPIVGPIIQAMEKVFGITDLVGQTIDSIKNAWDALFGPSSTTASNTTIIANQLVKTNADALAGFENVRRAVWFGFNMLSTTFGQQFGALSVNILTALKAINPRYSGAISDSSYGDRGSGFGRTVGPGSGGQSGYNVSPGGKLSWSDFIMRPGQGPTSFSPDDYIIGVKDPKKLGGSSTVNINIDRPMLTSQNDIKYLVRQIQQELFKEQRRFSSYV